jgi:hypothetical protein
VEQAHGILPPKKFTFSLQGMKRARIEHATEGIRIFECVKAMQRFNAQLILGPMIRRKALKSEPRLGVDFPANREKNREFYKIASLRVEFARYKPAKSAC